MDFAPKSGCPMCSIVATAVHAPSHSPRNPAFPAGSKQAEVLWRDDNFTIYRERANPVSSKGHLLVVFNLHVPSIYMLSTSDLPLLVTLRDLSRRLLSSLLPSSTPQSSPSIQAVTPVTAQTPAQLLPTRAASSSNNELFRIGFITPPFKDSKIPVTDHLHAHAYILPADLMGWWRAVGFSNLAWYDVDDLIAEIREESSNNRVRSGPSTHDRPRPIDQVPTAGARRGLSNGVETTDSSLAVDDIEDPESQPRRRSSALLSPTSTLGSNSPSQSPSSSRSPTRTNTTPHLTVDVGNNAPFTGAGGALIMSPIEDGLRTPTGTRHWSPSSPIPEIRL
ncbi:hypothetical protein QCA50_001548 [Cerrena zonata]|uniref:Uncharacterized protein n=1 Tax=Cerrena zonata TaxID=2478898 RepID=A0AAW0GW32_9APHY